MMHSATSIPVSQRWLIDRIQAIQHLFDEENHSYKEEYFDEKGVCFGIANMAVQAILAGDLDTYNKRLELLNSIPPDKLVESIKKVYQKIISAHRIAKSENKTIDNIELSLSEQERLLLSIPPFLDGVILYQRPASVPEFFEDNKRPTGQNAALTEPLTRPEKLSKIEKIDSFSGAFDFNTLSNYFFTLKKNLNNTKVPFALVLGNSKHAITIGYDDIQDAWTFTDANSLPTIYIKNVEELTKKTIEAFSSNSYTVFETSIYVEKNNLEKLHILQPWINEQKSKVTPSRLSITDSNGYTLLHLAIERRDKNLAEQILEQITNHSSNNKEALSLINKPDKNGKTPIMLAVQYKQIDLVSKMLQSVGHNPYAITPPHRVILLQHVMRMKNEEISNFIQTLEHNTYSIGNELNKLIKNNEFQRIENLPNGLEIIKVWNHFIKMLNEPKNKDKYIIDIYSEWKNQNTIPNIRNVDVLQPGLDKTSDFFKQSRSDSFIFMENLLDKYGSKKPNDFPEFSPQEIAKLFESMFLEKFAIKVCKFSERDKFISHWSNNKLSTLIRAHTGSEQVSKVKESVSETLNEFRNCDILNLKSSLSTSPLMKFIDELKPSQDTRPTMNS